MTVTTYGDLPGVEATISGGAVSQIAVGYEQKLVLFGRGDLSGGDASAETPKQIASDVDASTQFGESSELTTALQDALNNGVNPEYLYGVAATETTVSAETVSGGSGTLANAPIVEDASTITVQNTTQAQTETVVFRYESAPSTGSLASDEVAINPLTGEVEAGDSDDYDIDYSYLEWSNALDSADTVLNHNETGLYVTLSEAESVASTLGSKLDNLRPTYKLVRGVSGAQYNDTNTDGEPILDVSTYSDGLDNDALFLAGPVRIGGDTTDTVLGGIGGLMAGNNITDPIYGDALDGFTALTQSLTATEEGDPINDDGTGGSGLRGEQVMPIRDSALDGEGGITVEDSLSTSTLTDYPRDYHRRRIIDQILISAREVGETARGRRMTDALIEDTEGAMIDVFEELVRDGLLERAGDDQGDQVAPGGADQEATFSANITRSDTDELTIVISFIPVGVTKNIIEELVVAQSSAAA